MVLEQRCIKKWEKDKGTVHSLREMLKEKSKSLTCCNDTILERNFCSFSQDMLVEDITKTAMILPDDKGENTYWSAEGK